MESFPPPAFDLVNSSTLYHFSLLYFFLHNTYHHLLSLIFYLLFLSVVCLPQSLCICYKGKDFCLFCSLLYPRESRTIVDFKLPFILWQVLRTSPLPYTQNTNVTSDDSIAECWQGARWRTLSWKSSVRQTFSHSLGPPHPQSAILRAQSPDSLPFVATQSSHTNQDSAPGRA